MNNNATFDKIEAWLDGELPENEALAFKTAIDNNPELAAEVEQHKLARQAIERLVQLDLEDNLTRWRENMDDLPEPPEPEPRPRLPIMHLLSFLLSLLSFLLILSAGAIWYFWPPAPQEQPVKMQQEPQPGVPIADQTPTTPPEPPKAPEIKQPVSPAPNRPSYNRELVALADVGIETHRQALDRQYGTVMGGEDDEDPLFAAGLKAYKEENSREAIRLLRQIPAGSSYYASARELLALLYFEAKNFPAAARAYEAFAAEFSSPEADWRLALYYLAAYGSRKADFWKKMGEILVPADTPHPYKAQAGELKKTLEEKGIRGM